MLLELKQVAIGYSQQQLATDINIQIADAEIVCLLGRNGSGKTTLLKTILNLQAPLTGQIYIAGKPLSQWSAPELAQQIAYVPQAQHYCFSFSVLQMVLMGCQARLSLFATPSTQDTQRAYQALAILGIEQLAKQQIDQISGGERQLVLIARALTQSPKLLIMDEPAASLDFGNQIKLLNQIQQLKQLGIAVLMSTHHPRHAELVADSVVILHKHTHAIQGLPSALLTALELAKLYGVSQHSIERHLSGVTPPLFNTKVLP